MFASRENGSDSKKTKKQKNKKTFSHVAANRRVPTCTLYWTSDLGSSFYSRHFCLY